MQKFWPLTFVLFIALSSAVRADVLDPYDPFDSSVSADDSESDKDKSAEQLIDEAVLLFGDERPLDARTKLLKALEKDPKDYRAHMYLAGYYMDEVGHFRLALKYVKQAQALFEQSNGKPPYTEYLIQAQHDQLLYLLAQARLNLDDYQGALQTLDRYAELGYGRDWYPGTRAWVLMKLGRVEEAIKVARMGILTGAEPGRTMNMLGILLSMHNEREDSLKIFRQAVQYELSLGKLGRPATPLNNAGEVQDEIFQEDLAENSWLKSTRLPDGCEHVLPSLNLAMLYLDQNLPRKASETMDAFESCVAQFPLRNGEEHRSLVHYMRGRVELVTGHPAAAIAHFEKALANQQWFGKIGTNQEDLRVATTIFLAQALQAQDNHLRSRIPAGLTQRLEFMRDRTLNSLHAWWLMRRARQMLIEDLKNIEDLYIKNTDTLLDYATLGDVLAELPRAKLESRVALEQQKDGREPADAYYKTYLGANDLAHGHTESGAALLSHALNAVRDRYDDALRIKLMLMKLTLLDFASQDYLEWSRRVYRLNPAALRNAALPLPVRLSGNEASLIGGLLDQTNFKLSADQNLFNIQASSQNGLHTLSFTSTEPSVRSVTVRASDPVEALNNLCDQVFSEEIR